MTEVNIDSLIVRNIADLEAAIVRTRDEIDPKLNYEGLSALERALGDSWFFKHDKDPEEAWFAPCRWLEDQEEPDPYFALTTAHANEYKTWLAQYVAPTSDRQKVGIYWYSRLLNTSNYKLVMDGAVQELEFIRAAGFMLDEKKIYLPIEFDRELIAQGFETDDFTEAFTPIEKAAGVLQTAMEGFKALRDKMLAKHREFSQR